MKCGGTWEMLSKLFQIKTPTFIKTIVGFLEVVAPKMYDKWIAEYAGGNLGPHVPASPLCTYATDVTFQQSNRPSGSMAESMPWYSAKHKLYGFKVEVSVNPRGFHLSARRKADGDHRLPDNGPL
ncbi:hypothetical protein L914_17756 [Phytophthora nicotianae]|uniref:DDE Tnp4 domain-containing protein n=1 Tax=Phytophthora nicotianae TaxID=4792 RepID=W2MG91_PHYNI|nr:hypothetical protein L914_17756 [Phytophthora nicotianae]